MIADFTAIYDLHHAAILRYCLNKCRDMDLGKDLTQDTFLRYWVSLSRGEKVMNAKGFLYRIAHNVFIDHTRKKKDSSLDQMLETGFEPSVDTWTQTTARLDTTIVLKKLAVQKSPYGKLLHRRFIRGRTPVEIATLTGEHANAVSVRICRGLKHARLILENTKSPVVSRMRSTHRICDMRVSPLGSALKK